MKTRSGCVFEAQTAFVAELRIPRIGPGTRGAPTVAVPLPTPTRIAPMLAPVPPHHLPIAQHLANPDVHRPRKPRFAAPRQVRLLLERHKRELCAEQELVAISIVNVRQAKREAFILRARLEAVEGCRESEISALRNAGRDGFANLKVETTCAFHIQGRPYTSWTLRNAIVGWLQS